MSDSDDWNPRGVKKSKKSKKSVGTPKKAAKDPNAPKRPASAYILFVKDQREVLLQEHPNAKQTELMKLAGAAWKELDASEKAKYEKMNAEDKIRYENEMANYTPPKGLSATGKRKKIKDPNAPKRPSTPYFMFMNDNRQRIKEMNPDCAVSDIGKIAGKMWADLDDDKKMEYTNDYQTKMEEWRQRMDAYKKGNLNGAKKAKVSGDADLPTTSDSE